jgi:GT2 family glycosyltransferase
VGDVSILLSLYRAERFLEAYLDNVIGQTALSSVELSVVHNSPTATERTILDRYSSMIPMIRQEVSLEGLYASWNRAIIQSSGDYLVCWNVDDARLPDSLERMILTLEKSKEAGWTYGDFVITKKFGENFGKYMRTPEWSVEAGTRGSIGGPFFMWRRSLIPRVGYFDEQFQSGGDFDYTVRLSLLSVGKRTEGLLGYFLNERTGLSTRDESQAIERTVIQLRYGIHETLDRYYLKRCRSYRILDVQLPSKNFIPLSMSIQTHNMLSQTRKRVWWGELRSISFTIMSRIRRFIKKIINKWN